MMNLPYVTDADIAAVKKLPRSASDDLKDKINSYDPYNLFEQAGDSRNPDKRKIICPICGNGKGDDATPVEVEFKGDRWLYHCFRECGFQGDLLKIIATEEHLNLHDRSDMCKALAIGAQLIGYPLDPDFKHSTNKKNFAPTRKPENIASELPLIQKDITDAQNQLNSLPDSDRRGLTLETYRHFACGYLAKWTPPKSRAEKKYAPYSRRIIVPTSDNSHYLAALPLSERKKSNKPYWKMHAGAKTELFNLSALFSEAELILVVEGEIDAMSIWQASAGKIATVATLSVGGYKELLLPLLDDKKIPDKKFLLLFDGDDAGRTNAQNLRDELLKRNIPTVARFLFDFLSEADQKEFDTKVDANQILCERGNEFLHSIVTSLIADARADFEHHEKAYIDDKNFAEQIARWQRINGEIDSTVLPELKAARAFINALTPQTFNQNMPFDVITREQVALCKFYLPELAQKFLAVMKSAQRKAAEQIRELKAKKQSADITAELQQTADLKPSSFEKEIDSLVGSIRKQHKNARATREIERLNAEHDAKLKELETKNECTAKNVADCPINLKIPYDCYFNEKGIEIIDFSGRFPKTFQATRNPILPTRIFREPSKHLTQYEVAIKAGNVWRTAIVDGRTLFDPRKILELADFGVLIEDAPRLAKFFARILAENKNIIPEIKCYQRPGWHGDQFIYPTGSDDYIVRRAGFNYELEFANRGEREKWKQSFIDACKQGGAIARIFIGFALAAPLVRPLNISNPQIQINGKSGSGKTALEKLCASIYGNPRKLIRTFGATLKNRQAVAAAYADLPTFLDELGTLQGGKKGEESLPQMIYEYELGTANQANKRDGTARETFEFFGSRLMTGEYPILKSHDQRGVHKRLVQIHCEKLFDDYFATALHFICENHYGHFGKPWVEFVVTHLKKIQEVYLSFAKLFASLSHSVEPTLLKAVTVGAIAFQLFCVLLDEKEKFDESAAVEDIKEIIAALPNPNDLDDSTRAIEDLKSFADSHDKYFEHDVKDNSAEGFTTYSQNALECYGKKFSNGEVAFFPTALKKILEKELGFASMEALVSEWASKGKLRCSKGSGYRFSSWINGKAKSTIRFRASVLNQNVYTKNEETDSTERKSLSDLTTT